MKLTIGQLKQLIRESMMPDTYSVAVTNRGGEIDHVVVDDWQDVVPNVHSMRARHGETVDIWVNLGDSPVDGQGDGDDGWGGGLSIEQQDELADLNDPHLHF